MVERYKGEEISCYVVFVENLPNEGKWAKTVCASG